MSDDTAHDAILSRLDGLLQRLDAIERKVDALERLGATFDTVAKKAPILADGGAQVVNHFMMEAESRGVDVFARGERGLDVLEKASRPENMDLVDTLLDHGETARFAVTTGSRAVTAMGDPEAIATAVEKLSAKGGAVLTSPALDKILESALMDPAKLEASVDALTRLVEVATTPAFQKLLDSGVLDPSVLGTATNATTALVEAKKAGIEPVGLFGTLGKLGDPDVQKAMGFAFAIAKRFGATL